MQALRKTRRKRPALPKRAPETAAKASAGAEDIGVRALADAVLEVAAQQDDQSHQGQYRLASERHALQLIRSIFSATTAAAGSARGSGISIGAALALRGSGRLPLAVLGDGDFMMGVSGLWTATRHGIGLMIVVANNLSFFNDEMHQERMALQRGRPPENRWIGQRIAGPDIDIAALAKAQGRRRHRTGRTRARSCARCCAARPSRR